MQSKENKLFRKEALERISSPERLDQLMTVVNPRAWLPLATIGSLVFVAVIWSVFGRLPFNVKGQGVLIRPRLVVKFQAPSTGRLSKLNVQSGDRVKKGDVLGTISQDALAQELLQEQEKLTELLGQNQKSDRLQRSKTFLEAQNLAQQRANLRESLKRESIVPKLREKSFELFRENRASLERSLVSAEKIVPELYEQGIESIAQARQSLQQQLEQLRSLLPNLKQRLEERRRLLERQLITGDALLIAEREYLDSSAKLSELEARLKQLDVEETAIRGQNLQNLNLTDQIKIGLQDLEVQEANVQREYLQSLNKIDSLKSEINEVKSKEAQLAQQNLEKSFDTDNKIQEVKRRIAQLEKELTGKSQIISQYDGKILEINIVKGQIIGNDMDLGSIETEDPKSQLVGVIYFADKDGKKIKPGMPVQVNPSPVERERYGGIQGEVTQVAPFPITVRDMATIIGNENVAVNIAESLTKSGTKAAIQVFVKLERDTNTISGYKWSSSKGPPIELSSGTTTQVQVKVGEVAPISYIIPILRSLTGVY
jgi:NHLM bacteriocin system secretion protein